MLNRLLARQNGSDRPPASPSEAIEGALHRYALSGDLVASHAVPNYSAFHEWLGARLRPRHIGMIASTRHLEAGYDTAGYIAAFALIIKAYKDRFQSNIAGPMSSSRVPEILELNKFKLLLSTEQQLTDRGLGVIEALQKHTTGEPHLDQGLEGCTQAELRLRLFAAIEKNKERLAFKILGKLREEAHDPGELDYLEALCHFKANDFDETLRYARRVGSHNVDYTSARALIFESLVYRGLANDFVRELNDTDLGELSPLYFRHLCQVLIRNSDAPERSVAAIDSLGERMSRLGAVKQSDPALPTYNRYSCALAVEWGERLREYELQTRAAMQGGMPNSVGASSASDEDRGTSSETEVLGLAEQRLLYSLLIDADLCDQVSASAHDERFIPIVKRLINVPYEANFQDFVQACLAQFRLGGGRQFVDNVIATLDRIKGAPDCPEKWELLDLACVEAAALQHVGVRALEDALTAAPGYAARLVKPSELAKTISLIRKLSPMAQLAYQSVTWMLQEAARPGFLWKDAGMISLGFFRILELELNERLIRPLAVALNKQRFGDARVRVLAALAANASDLSGNEKTRRQQSIDFWKRLLKSIDDVLLNKKAGLELGALELLLEKTRQPEGEDAELKAILFEGIASLMNDRGKRAYSAGEISALISQEHRDRFRNPPAHTRFVTLSTAEECKLHVDKSLEALIEWTDSGIASLQTIGR